jgi:putative transposase
LPNSQTFFFYKNPPHKKPKRARVNLLGTIIFRVELKKEIMSDAYRTYPGKLYYVTLTVVGWIDIFTRKEYVYAIIENLKYCQANKGLDIYAYVIMSNHLHLVCKVRDESLNDVLGDFKSYTAKQLIKMVEEHPQESRKEWMTHLFKYFGRGNSQNKEYQFWKNGNHAFELWSNEMIKQKIDYIHNNPVKAGLVLKPHHYLNSSANEQGPLAVLKV